MPRIRTVKPAYPKNRKVRSVSRDARLLNIHLWNLADDEGRLQELPQWIIGEVFPTDEDVTPVQLREWLGSLHDAGLIARYEVDGERYIQCRNFTEHQVINKPRPSEIPACPAGPCDSGSTTGALPDDSLPEVEEEREGEKEEETTAPDHLVSVVGLLDRTAFARGISSPKVAAAIEACERYADRDLEAEAEKFRHYWIEGPGEKRPLTDVAWSWRSWLERAKPAAQASPRDSVTSDLQRLEAEAHRLRAEEAAA